MSEKWETVSKANQGGSKKSTANGKAAGGQGKAPKKEKMVYSPEDVLPASSVDNMYASAFDPAPKSPKKVSNGTGNKPAPAKPKVAEKKVEKPKVPGTVTEAVKEKLRVEDLKLLIEEVQQRWPDSPLLWLRDVATYLNLNLVSQTECVGDVLGGSPASALTANMRKVIGAMLAKAEEGMRETFFETCVANTAHELAKGQCVAGWRVLTQMLADLQPTVVTAHLPRYVELRNSYQNRPAVGLAILWSVGQAGNKSLHSGIKVWLEVMLPVVTLKHYTKYVVDYLGALLAAHNISTGTQLNKPVMDISNLVTVQDTVFIVAQGINKEHARSLMKLYPALRNIALAGARNHELFPALLPRLANLSTPELVLDTLEILCMCLVACPAATVHWHKLYTSHLDQSGQLLNYLDCNWTSYRGVLEQPTFQETLEAFQDYNSSVVNKPGLQLATDGANAVASRFSVGGMAWFPWKTLSFLLLISTAAIINMDIERSGGSFKKCNTGQFLSDIGQYERVVNSANWVLATSHQSREWGRTTIPVYWAKGAKAVGPYVEVAGAKLGEIKVGAQTLGQEGLQWLELRLPGLRERLAQLGVSLTKGTALLVVRARELGLSAREGVTTLLSGETDWALVKAKAVELVEKMQQQMVSAVNYVQVQLKQLVK